MSHRLNMGNLRSAFPMVLAGAFVALPLAAGHASAASALLITNRVYDPANPAALNAALAASLDSIETTVNTTILSPANQQSLADGLSKANSSSSVGYAFDRVESPTYLSVTGAVQGGLYYKGSSSTAASNTLPSLGIGAQTGVRVGFMGSRIGLPSRGVFSSDKLQIGIHGFGFNTTAKDVKLGFFNAGATVQYKVFNPKGTAFLVEWGGIDIGTGLGYGHNSAKYGASLSQSTTQNVPGGGSVTTSATMNYELEVESSNFYIPFEVSTSARLLYFLSVYSGGGVDLNFGTSRLKGTGSGPVTATTNAAGAPASIFSGTASLDLSRDGIESSPSVTIFRGFGGVQFNFSLVRVFADFSMLSNDAKLVTAGLRLML